MNAASHPDLAALRGYTFGNLVWADLEGIEAHLNGCAACRSQVATLESSADSFIACLRDAVAEPADEAALEALLDRVRSLIQPTGSFALDDTKIIAGHVLLHELASGGFGVVYLARHRLLGELRAIKRPRLREEVDGDILLARFRREVQAVGAVRHDHVIRAHDAGTDDEGPYLVMEYLQGESLSGLLRRHRRLPVPQACELVRQAALGLQAGHERGLVHRDVKPSNLMLACTGSAARVVVIDWGLVRFTRAADPGNSPAVPGPTGTGIGLGTPDYMAPEQVEDARGVDIRADIYSLGVTLYCLLAGKPPFHDRSTLQKLLTQQSEAFPPLDPDHLPIPADLLAVLAKMVHKDRAQRYATPAAAAAALQPFSCAETSLRALLDGPIPPPLPLPRPDRRWPRLRLGWLLAGALGLMVLGIVLSWMARGKPTTTQRNLAAGPDSSVSMEERHTGYCSSLVFLPDGLHAVSESGGNFICLWNVGDRRRQRMEQHGYGRPFEDIGGTVTASPDGKYFAAAAVNPADRGMQILSLLDPKTCKPVTKDFGFSGMTGAIAFSPDGSRLAVAVVPGLFGLAEILGQPPSIAILDVRNSKRQEFKVTSKVLSLAFSPDGKSLLTGCYDNHVRIWRLETRPVGKEYAGHDGPVERVGFAKDGKRFFSSSTVDSTLRVWGNEKGAEGLKQTFKVDRGARMTCTAFWPGDRAVSGHDDGSVIIWDLAAGAELQRFQGKGAKVTAVAISPDGSQALAALADGRVNLYRLPPYSGP